MRFHILWRPRKARAASIAAHTASGALQVRGCRGDLACVVRTGAERALVYEGYDEPNDRLRRGTSRSRRYFLVAPGEQLEE